MLLTYTHISRTHIIRIDKRTESGIKIEISHTKEQNITNSANKNVFLIECVTQYQLQESIARIK